MSDSIDDAIAEVDRELAEARAHAGRVKEQSLSKEWTKQKRAGATKRIYNLMERRNGLVWKKAFPQAEYLYDVRVVGLTGQPEFEQSPRVYDTVQIKNDFVQPAEIKAPGVVPNSVKGGLKDDDILVHFREKSSVGKQIRTEKELIESAKRQGEKIILEGYEVVHNSKIRIEVDPSNLEISRVVRYGELPDKHLLGDSEVIGGTNRSVARAGTESAEAGARALSRTVGGQETELPNRAVENRIRGSTGRYAATGKAGTISPVEAPTVTPSIPRDIDVRIKPSKLVFHFVRGLIINLLIDFALRSLLNYFLKKLDESNQTQLRNEWQWKVYPAIESRVRYHMEQSSAGKQPEAAGSSPAARAKMSPNSRVFIRVRWNMVWKVQAASAGDVAVWFAQFGLGDPGFVEIFEYIEKPFSVDVEIADKPRPAPIWRRPDSKDSNLVRYEVDQWILVHDPFVLTLARLFQENLRRILDAFQPIKSIYSRIDPAGRYTDQMKQIENSLNQFAYEHTAQQIDHLLTRTLESVDIPARDLIKSMRALEQECFAAKARIQYYRLMLNDEQKILLDGLLGVRL